MKKEQNLDFDNITPRKGTDCLKYDFAKKRGMPEDVLPLWVADMDFPTSSFVLDAIREKADHGIFGYTETQTPYYQAVADWLKNHHGFDTKESWLVKTPGVVFALAMAVKAYTKVGDAVLVQQPVYYPFSEVILDNDRRLVSNDLVLLEDGRFGIDFEDFEEKIVSEKVKLFLLCNPHNPVGRVWTKEELTRIGEICKKHQVIVVSDEIHQDFVWGPHTHVPFCSVDESWQEFTITCTSPAKTFNLAGLQISNIFIPNVQLRKAFKRQVAAAGYSQLNTMGIVAGEAAYRYGDAWYQAMKAYVEDNIAFVQEYVEKHLPALKVTPTEGTYLVWINCRGLGLSAEDLEDLVIHKAGLWLDGGAMFGPVGAGFQRINVACPRSVLKEALKRLKAAIDTL